MLSSFHFIKKKLKGRSAGPLLGRLAEQPSKEIVTLRTAKHGKRRPSAGWRLAEGRRSYGRRKLRLVVRISRKSVSFLLFSKAGQLGHY
jgi:hypothetical protein